MHLILPLAFVLSTIVLAPAASADPILSLVPTEIEFSPADTVVTVAVDPNDTPLSGVLLNFSALASGLEILGITPTDPAVFPSGPQLQEGDWVAGFSGQFIQADRTQPFEVGTLLLEGFVLDTPLVLTGNYTDGNFNDIPFGPMEVAWVPEPGTSALQLTALAALSALSLSRPSLRRRTLSRHRRGATR